MSKVIALCQHKGGVGKTVTTVNLGASLAEQGLHVLVVDLDPQAALTQSLGINPAELQHSVYDLFADPDYSAPEVILATSVPGLWIVPSHLNLSVAEMQFSHRVGRERILRKKLEMVREQYDVILIDTPPVLGLLTMNAMAASDSLVIPIQCELLSLYGLKHLLDMVNVIREDVNPELEIEGFLLTMYDARTRLSEDVAANVRRTFGNQVFDTVIRRRTVLAEAPAEGQPITTFASRSEAAEDYRQLAQEILHRG